LPAKTSATRNFPDDGGAMREPRTRSAVARVEIPRTTPTRRYATLRRRNGSAFRPRFGNVIVRTPWAISACMAPKS
jgi:hypothetical protein